MSIYTGRPVKMKSHDVTLSYLNRSSNGYWQSVDLMKGTEQKWDKVPLYFGPLHPYPSELRKNEKDHLLEMGCRPMNGHLEKTEVIEAGRPRMMSHLNLDKEEELERFIAEGKVGLSISYEAAGEDIDMDTWDIIPLPPIEPNHVLFFYEGKFVQPGDKGSGVMNVKKTKFQRAKDAIVALFSKVEKEEEEIEIEIPDPIPADPPADPAPATPPAVDPPVAQTEPAPAPVPAPVVAQMEDPKVVTLTATIAERESKITELEKLVALFEKAEKDRSWDAFKAQVPPGMIHGEKEAEVRQLWETDPGKVALDVLAFKEGQTSTPREGYPNVSTDGRTFVEDGVEYYKETIPSPVMAEYKRMRAEQQPPTPPVQPSPAS